MSRICTDAGVLLRLLLPYCLFFCLLTCFLCLSARSQWTISGNNIYNSNTGNVGIGTTSPSTPLQINGSVNDPLSVKSAEKV